MLAGRTSIRSAVRRGDDRKAYQDSPSEFHVDGSVRSIGICDRVEFGFEVVRGWMSGKVIDAWNRVTLAEAK